MSLPHGIAEPLHINEPFPMWTLLAGGLVLWLLYRLFRTLRSRLAQAPPPAATPPAVPAADHRIAAMIESIRLRYREPYACRRGCHELAAALREHLERSSEKPATADPLTTLTAAEMTETIGDSAVARFFGLLSLLQFHRRPPTTSDFDGACDLALEVAQSPGTLEQRIVIESWAFAHPWVLGALGILFGYGMLRSWQSRRDFQLYAPLQYRRGSDRGRWLGYLCLPLELLLLAVVIVGLAGPHRTTDLELIEDEGIDVALVLDVSLSMLAEDFPPNRLEALRGIASDFISRSGSHRVALVMFARDAYVQTPLTTDHRVLRELLGGVTVDAIDQALSGGTAIGDALLVAAQHLAANKIENRDQAVVLITDGESNLGSDPILGARYLSHLEARLYAIGVGGEDPIEVFVEGRRLGGDDPYMAFLDDTQLREMADAVDGSYYRATDVGALEDVFGELSRLEGAPLEVRNVGVRRYFTRHFAFASLPLFSFYLWLAGVRLRRPYR